MIIKPFLLNSNPFIQAYTESGLLGKTIFFSLIALSIITWVILLFKWQQTKICKKNNLLFKKKFSSFRNNPLNIDLPSAKMNHPFQTVYRQLKRQTLELLQKNKNFEGQTILSSADIHLVKAQLHSHRKQQTNLLEKNLYILSTIVTLAPFVGLLGTVWGILTTFSHMQSSSGGGGSTNQLVLGGLSLALTTTVIGLIDAIPALIGYQFLKNKINSIDADIEHFSVDLLTAVEMQYKKVDL
ncbi:MotA/TolQ/ExbB proton channel family protein [Chlamydiales bacterium]|nr:MotA/TolQ/ExbB proton channel family protein [Chlamydiales bacterium]